MRISAAPDSSQEKAAGIAVLTHPDWRWKRCDIKSLNLLANVLARQDATERGYDEAVLVDEAGWITEGAGSAFFAILGNTLQTAPLTANILPSITRAYIIKAAHSLGMEVIEQSLTPAQAASADELFIAMTTKDIVPVIKFDQTTIADGKPGPRTQAIAEAFLKSTT